MVPPFSVLIVDEHELMRWAIATLLTREFSATIWGAVAYPRGAKALLRRPRQELPTIIITELLFSQGAGVDFATTLRDEYFGKVRVLVYTSEPEDLYADRLLKLGIYGFVRKQQSEADLVDSIEKIVRGEVAFSPNMTRRLLSGRRSVSPDSQNPEDALSNRELQVFQLIGQGLSTRKIAQTLHLSTKTVDAYRNNIKEKLQLPDAAAVSHFAAVRWAQRQQL